MEIHSCRNCQLIDDVVSSKTQRFDILTEENVTLHLALLNARESIVSLEAEVLDLNNAIAAERQRNLDLYLKQINQKNNSNILLNVIWKANEKIAEKHVSYNKKVSFQPPSVSSNLTETVTSDKYQSLMNLYEEQKKMYEENLEMLQNGYEKYVKMLKEQLQKAREHSSVVLDMYTVYRKQFFTQKQENARDHKEFFDAIEALNKFNSKHIEEVETKVLEEITFAVGEQSRGAFKSLFQQIHKRDRLVHMLRRQQMQFDGEIDKLEKQITSERQKAERINNELKRQLQNERRKYAILEQRRAFDLEGFHTDIQQFRKKLTRLKAPFNLAKLEDKMDSIEKRLSFNYSEE